MGAGSPEGVHRRRTLLLFLTTLLVLAVAAARMAPGMARRGDEASPGVCSCRRGTSADDLAQEGLNMIAEISCTPKGWGDDLLFIAARHIDQELAS